jgi:glycerophosphoryl diester phosphodiesterase
MKRFSLVLIAVILSCNAICKAQQIVLPNAHSHNDYAQAVPFYHAYNSGFGSIEADVFLVNGKLLVAHDEKNLQADRTLKKMYLDPIKKALKKDTSRQLTLLIDIKKNNAPVLVELIEELKPLKKLCKGDDNPKGRLLILISGERPLPALFKTYPPYIYFDEDLRAIYSADDLTRVGQISLRYSKYAKWTGAGAIPIADEAKLKHIIDSVHTMGKPIRFWDAPDNSAGWAELKKLHADMLGTDRIDELSAFLKQ